MHEGTDATREAGCDEDLAHLTVQERVRKLPEALVLTAGYYASLVPGLSELIRRTG
jgi:hypothetical protein